jgi:histidinol-phosphate phosphatase family protein
MILKTLNISKEWSLFLDRDGVINRRIVGDYVKDPKEFIFLDGVVDAIRTFTTTFGRIVVVTNQQGIGKGLMTHEELNEIHNHMSAEISKGGGRIDKMYYCPELARQNPFRRKPNIGMALHAKKDFPEINFRKSIMAGDSKSDLEFGKRLKMKTVLIGDNNTIARRFPKLVDFWFPSLAEMAKQITN